MMTAAKKMTIGDTIIDYRRKKPHSTCEEITDYVKKHFPGCRTNPLSVACTLSKAGMAPGQVMNNGKPGKSTKPPSSGPVDVSKLPEASPEESETQARERITLRFDAMERISRRAVDGKLPSFIVSGPPGVGKSWTVTEALRESGRVRHDGLTNVGGGGPNDELGTVGYYDHIGGGCTAVGLYHALWNMRNGGVIFLDDCDGVFYDDESLNLLKVATDSTRERLCSWRKNAAWLDEYEIDKTFDFKGHIIFLTNIDFEQVIERGHRDSEHFKALIDRSSYLCLTLRTARDFMIRISDVSSGPHGMLAKYHGFNEVQIKECLDFVRLHQKRFYNLSLRLVGQIAKYMIADPAGWKQDIEATKMRTF